ncbi:MAG: hypothetical protein COY81_04810 [Candidatus Pacebacteria bacterium CG_4_10_14_0_8_um_filter_43_12]|nr:MAG: hypothetical protein COY81_04810 [Candidatus Pacebacteria bacterium CG_4_10_14_0_8_um_filter_43_12]
MIDLNQIPRPTSKQTPAADAKTVFQGQIFSVQQWQQQQFDGSFTTFERLSRPDTVGIVAVTEDHRIVLTQQEQPSMQPFLSLVGGIIDPNETAFQTAQRELSEEAGATAKSWQYWFGVQPLTKIDWALYLFIARGCRIEQQQQLDPGEKIKLWPVAYQEFLTIIFEPNFRDHQVTLKIAQLLQSGKELELRRQILGE